MPEMYAEEFMVRASVQILMADPEHIKPEGFGSGCIAKYKGNFYLLSVFHVINHNDLSVFIETNQPPREDKTVDVIPVGGLVYFDLLKVSDKMSAEELVKAIDIGGKRLDVTFAKVNITVDILQPEIDFGGLKVDAGGKMFIDLDNIAVPDVSETYGFFGKVQPKYEGYYLKMKPTLRNGLKYHGSNKYFHKFIAPEKITSADDYAGTSGAPILDSQGRLVALACLVGVGSNLIMGFSIQQCINLLDMAIKAKQFETEN